MLTTILAMRSSRFGIASRARLIARIGRLTENAKMARVLDHMTYLQDMGVEGDVMLFMADEIRKDVRMVLLMGYQDEVRIALN